MLSSGSKMAENGKKNGHFCPRVKKNEKNDNFFNFKVDFWDFGWAYDPEIDTIRFRIKFWSLLKRKVRNFVNIWENYEINELVVKILKKYRNFFEKLYFWKKIVQWSSFISHFKVFFYDKHSFILYFCLKKQIYRVKIDKICKNWKLNLFSKFKKITTFR